MQSVENTKIIADLEAALNDFDPAVRRSALMELNSLARQNGVLLESAADVANMHCHTFFSFNAYGYSPSALAWLAKRRGFGVIGTVDFDVLDAVDEFLDACELVGVRGSTGLETRTFLPEFSTRETNSPGEPGILYHMGIGFTSSAVPAEARPMLDNLRQRAAQRNKGVVDRLNVYLDPVRIDYEHEVIPLTPGGNPTERHIVVAYVNAAARAANDPAEFWAGKLSMTREQAEKLMSDQANFQNTLRSKLMKKGGPGYVQPGPESFPSVDEVNRFTLACGALPCAAWLDGTSTGEQAIGELLALLVGKGAVALNIVPDRNWNIADPAVKKLKLEKLYEVVQLAQELDLPLNIGTEMNSFGNKLVDTFDAPELASVRQAFLDGAYFIYGHTALQRGYGLGYQSEWAKANLPTRRERNEFYTKAGYQIEPGKADLALDATMTPEQVLERLSAQ